MKRVLISLVVIITSTVSYGQVGINTKTPKASLDIEAGSDRTSEKVEGLLIPRVTKEKAYRMGNNTMPPTESTMIYVSDLSDTGATKFTFPTLGQIVVEDITEKGYYSWNGTKWVKTTNEEWVYKSSNKQIDLRRSGSAPFDNKVYYDEKGGFKNLGFDSYKTHDDNGVSETLDLTSKKGQNITSKRSSKIESYSRRGEGYKILTEKILLADESSNDSNLAGTSSEVSVEENNSVNYDFIKGSSSSVYHQGNGTVSNLVGGDFNAYLNGGATSKSDGYVTGIRSASQLRQGTVNNIYSLTGFILMGQNAKEIERRAVSGNFYMIYKQGTNVKIKDNIGVRVRNYLEEGANPSIERAAGFYYEEFKYDKSKTKPTPTIKDNYGILLEDIDSGTNNYAIYSNAGKIRFGDLKGSSERIVVTNNDGVLSTKALSDIKGTVYKEGDGILLTPNSSDNTTSINSLWKIESDKIILTKKSDKTARSLSTATKNDRNDISFDDRGMLTARGIYGYNGSAAYPDYVFEKYYKGYSIIKADYNFKTLSQIESFIKEKGHLPGYKSAKEIAEEGLIDIGATQLTNVEKIEELYLHIIEQDKALKEKDSKIKELEARLERLAFPLEVEIK